VIHLGSYVEFGPSSPQYLWLQQDLEAFSRDKTPWLIVNFHAPWYHNYRAHYKEAACHQLAMEQLLHDAGVDMVFTGTLPPPRYLPPYQQLPSQDALLTGICPAFFVQAIMEATA